MEYRVVRLAEGRRRRGSNSSQNTVAIHLLGVDTRGTPGRLIVVYE